MSRSLPEVGRVIEVTKGRDSGTVCVVIGHEFDRYVIVADGDKRKIDKPKKKNVAHIRNTPYIAREVVDELTQEGKVSNAKLRHVLRKYLTEAAGNAEQEGGQPNGQG